MNTRLLETFVCLARLKNFSKTAEMLHMTQPAVSSRMSRMEELVGAELYRRDTREFELTSQGRVTLEYAERILDLWADLNKSIKGTPHEIEEFRIGIIEMGMLSWLTRFLALFREDFPGVLVNIRSGTSSLLLDELRDDVTDIAFVVGPVNEDNIHSAQICSLSLAWYGSPRHFPCDQEIDVVELSRMPIIPYSPNSSVSNALTQYFETYGIMDLPMWRQQVVVTSVYSAWSGAYAVREGLGVMALPSFSFRAEIEAGHIAQLRVRQKIPALNITACYKRTRSGTVFAKAVNIARQSASEFAKLQNENEFWI